MDPNFQTSNPYQNNFSDVAEIKNTLSRIEAQLMRIDSGKTTGGQLTALDNMADTLEKQATSLDNIADVSEDIRNKIDSNEIIRCLEENNSLLRELISYVSRISS